MKKIIYPTLFVFFASFFLELAVRGNYISEIIFPRPSQVLIALIENSNVLLAGLLDSLISILISYFLSLFVGILSAVIFSSVSFLRLAIYPYTVFFQTVPIIAIAPLLVIWFGFGRPTVVATSFIVSVFPIIANTMSGLLNIKKEYLELFKIYKTKKTFELLYLRLPSSLNSIKTGSLISAGLSVIGVIVGEFIAGGGLGSIIDAARTQQRLDLVFAAVICTSFLGLSLILFTHLIFNVFFKKYLINQ